MLIIGYIMKNVLLFIGLFERGYDENKLAAKKMV